MDRKGRQQWPLRLAWPPSMSTGASADDSSWGTGKVTSILMEGNQGLSWRGVSGLSTTGTGQNKGLRWGESSPGNG